MSRRVPSASRAASARARFASLPHDRARRRALPAIASNVAVPVVGLIDTAMIGHFSDAVGHLQRALAMAGALGTRDRSPPPRRYEPKWGETRQLRNAQRGQIRRVDSRIGS